MSADRRVTRRTFFAGVGGAGLMVGGGVAAAEAGAQGPASDAPEVPIPDVSGRIARLDLGTGIVDLVDADPGRARARLLVSATTLVERVGPSSLSAFAVGERIVAFGAWQDDTTLATTRIAATFSVLRERIAEREGVRLQMAGGVTVDPSAVRDVSPFSDPESYRPIAPAALGDLSAPDRIEVLGILNEDSKTLTAVNVGLALS
ncbi:MAG TPA: hypothetical protein VFG74_10215 [Miltoncostaeaceae bacterium]|nr:hypothetical protein [Miltoncostaeaceae bacterium]